MRRVLPLLPLLLLPALLLRDAATPGRFPGQAFGEGWGHLFAAGQAMRWFTGVATPGWADLLAFPAGRPFWPVDPLTTGAAAWIGWMGGGTASALAAGISALVLLHLVATGAGTWVLARTAGAMPWAATAVGLGAQVHPFLLRSGQEGIVEALALGPAALLAAAGLHLCRAPGWRAGLLAAAAALAAGLTSPYYAVYAALLWVLVAPLALWRRVGRGWAALGMALALGCALAAAPLLAAETGSGGRLDPRFAGGGYRVAPTCAVVCAADGTPAPAPPPPAPPPAVESLRDLRALQAFPGGLACAAALGLGLAARRGRPWALAALVLFALGAGPQLVARTFLPPMPVPASPLQEILQRLPVTGQLGNAQRLVVLYALPALVAGAVACGSAAARALGLGLAVLAELALVLPGLRLATTPVAVDPAVLAAVTGPAVTFPDGDPPLWNAGVAPKRALFLAAVHGQPVGGDYGRGGIPADLALRLELSSWAGIAFDRGAVPAGGRVTPAADPPGFSHLLLLFETLEPAQRDALRTRARDRWGAPLAASAWGEVYALAP